MDKGIARKQITETFRLPSGPGKTLEMKRDREIERKEGEVFTLNDQDRPEMGQT